MLWLDIVFSLVLFSCIFHSFSNDSTKHDENKVKAAAGRVNIIVVSENIKNIGTLHKQS